jgi:hypothetical protein
LPDGAGPAGFWFSASELWVSLPGEEAPRLLVHENFSANLDLNGIASVTRARTYEWPEPNALPEEQQIGTWEDLDPSKPTGPLSIVGNVYGYGPATGPQKMAEAASCFRRDVVSDCP